MRSDLPPEAIRPNVPAGTPLSLAADANRLGFWCPVHGVRFGWDADEGGYMPRDVPDCDADHPPQSLRTPGNLPAGCGEAVGYDPAKHPNIGPAAVDRAVAEVLAERAMRRKLH